MSEPLVYPFQYFQKCPKCKYDPNEPFNKDFGITYLVDNDILELSCPHCSYTWREYPADRFAKEQKT